MLRWRRAPLGTKIGGCDIRQSMASFGSTGQKCCALAVRPRSNRSCSTRSPEFVDEVPLVSWDRPCPPHTHTDWCYEESERGCGRETETCRTCRGSGSLPRGIALVEDPPQGWRAKTCCIQVLEDGRLAISTSMDVRPLVLTAESTKQVVDWFAGGCGVADRRMPPKSTAAGATAFTEEDLP